MIRKSEFVAKSQFLFNFHIELKSVPLFKIKMICILLVAGHASSLEAEIAADRSGKYSHLEGVPKVLKIYGAGGPLLFLKSTWFKIFLGYR